jgi:class 3 adenylate cyclase
MHSNALTNSFLQILSGILLQHLKSSQLCHQGNRSQTMEDRRLAAIVFTDIVGYSSMMANDETTALAIVQQQRDILLPIIAEYNGQWLKEMGDGTLSSFASASRAVLCAIEIQTQLKVLDHFKVRIGIHLGDVVFTERDVFGDGVNVAARIESVAQPGGIAISGQVFDTLSSNKSIETKFLGEKILKNIDRPIRIYGVSNKGLPVGEAWRNLPNKSPKYLQNSVILTLSKRPWSSTLVAAAAAAAAIILLSFTLNRQAVKPVLPTSETASNPITSDENNPDRQAASLTVEELLDTDLSREPVELETLPFNSQQEGHASDPEAIFVTPVLESVPVFNTQSQSSAPSTELVNAEQAATRNTVGQAPPAAESNEPPSAINQAQKSFD